MKHVVITRLNTKNSTGLNNDPEWLSHRLGMFEQFCLPSVLGQTCLDFDWYVFVSLDSPGMVRDRLQRMGCVPVIALADKFEAWGVAATCDWEPRDDWLVTTRLDSDDAIHKTFVEEVQRRWQPEPSWGHGMVMNFQEGVGLNYDAKELTSMRRPVNEFMSFAERWWRHQQPRTVFDSSMPAEMGQRFPVTRIDIGKPMWMKVWHGKNCIQKEPWPEVPAYGVDVKEEFGVIAEYCEPAPMRPAREIK